MRLLMEAAEAFSAGADIILLRRSAPARPALNSPLPVSVVPVGAALRRGPAPAPLSCLSAAARIPTLPGAGRLGSAASSGERAAARASAASRPVAHIPPSFSEGI